MEKFKKIMKYTVNIINFANAIIIGLTPIWHWEWGTLVSDTLIVISGAISVYLLGTKALSKKDGGDIPIAPQNHLEDEAYETSD